MPSSCHLGTSNHTPTDQFEDDLGLSILGLGAEYPPHRHGSDSLDILAARYYKSSPATTKVLSINRFTGIEQRASIGDVDHPIVNQPDAPSIKDLDELFRDHGVRISVAASRKAINEWGGNISDITHTVATTCTNSANPGFDHFVRKQLGIRKTTENVLLHGIGCSGGLAAIRTACNLALGASYRKKPARILVMACEIATPLFRSELDSIDKDQTVRIGVCLFSDGASACIISNNIGAKPDEYSTFDILGWKHDIIEDTEEDLGFDVDPAGWKVVLTPRVPELTCKTAMPTFERLVESIPSLSRNKELPSAADFDWALHPGGSTIIAGVQKAANLTEDHLRASYHIYMNYGNSSSATIISVMNRLRNLGEGRENVVACAFGPGISIEMMILRRGIEYSAQEQARRDEASKVLGADLPEGRIPNGVDTANGYHDANGANGSNGVNGVNGMNGVNGANGINGTNGESHETHVNGAVESNGICMVPVDDLD